MTSLRRLFLVLLVAALLLSAPVAAEEELPSGSEALEKAEALRAAKQPRKALPLYERAIASGKDEPVVRLAAARCAFEAGLYARAVALSRTGSEALKKIQPVTEEVRTTREQLRSVEKDALVQKHLRDKLVPKIVGEVIRDLPHDTLIRESRYLTDNEHDGGGVARQKLREDHAGRHLGVRIVRRDPDWYARVTIVEQYPDEATANRRFDGIMKVIKAQRQKWERVFRDRRKTRGFKLETVASVRGKHLDKERLVHRRTTYRWRAKNQPNLEHDEMAKLVLVQPVMHAAPLPAEETWYALRLTLDGYFFEFQR